jgi:acyl-CoA thioesterase-2
MTGYQGELDQLLDLAAADHGHWRGRGRPAFGNRVFGGHLLAQAVRASNSLQQSVRPVNSLHAHFLAAARAGSDIDYTVDAVKQGRALDIHQVVASQAGRPVAMCTVSYHAAEASAAYQKRMPAVRGPAQLKPVSYTPPGTHAEVREPFELRYLDDRFRDENGPDDEPALSTWIRARQPVASAVQPDHAALLAYAVDFLISRVAHMPVRNDILPVGASLDHAMWFHRPFRVDDWLLVSCSTSTFAGARSLSQSEIFDSRGQLVATAVQEALLRGATE